MLPHVLVPALWLSTAAGRLGWCKEGHQARAWRLPVPLSTIHWGSFFGWYVICGNSHIEITGSLQE